MEHTGGEASITVTEAICERVDERVLFDHPRERQIKGKGLMTIYTARLAD